MQGRLVTNPYGQWVPDQLSPSGFRWRDHDEADPTSMLPVVEPVTPDTATVDVPPRLDDWCEDRSPDELTDDDGRD